MKSKSNSVITFIILFMIIFLVGVLFAAISSNGSSSDDTTADGFTIDSYNVILDVQEDNKVYVTETITVNWYEDTHHGIYKFIPEWLEYTGKDGKTIKRKSLVSNLEAVDDEYTTDYINKKARIKIGSSSSYVDLGLKTYMITYVYDMGSDPYDGFDEFIFHAFGDYWGTSINNASIKIIMPQSIENYDVNFFTDKNRNNNVNSCVSYYAIGNVLSATYDDSKCDVLEKSLTVDIELPEGYFVMGSSNYGWYSFTMIMLIFVVTCLIIYFWFRYGRDYPDEAKTVEFYPPNNFSSAEIGFIYSKETSSKLTISLIVSLAGKGYIKIDEINDDKSKKQIQITNNKNATNMNSYEKIVYDRLFEEKDVVILSEHKNFYQAFKDINNKLQNELKYLILEKTSTKILAISFAFTLINGLLWFLSYCIFEDMNPNLNFLYIMSFVCVFACIFFTSIMGRQTKYGEKVFAQVIGFREFLNTAEKSRLEMLVKENPNYFYDILPYTYVLGVSKKWVENFENIPIPHVDTGSYDIYNPGSIDHIGSSGSSGGCSSCGGGCSSCGGGGSW